jgi:hypothetical protein
MEGFTEQDFHDYKEYFTQYENEALSGLSQLNYDETFTE